MPQILGNSMFPRESSRELQVPILESIWQLPAWLLLGASCLLGERVFASRLALERRNNFLLQIRPALEDLLSALVKVSVALLEQGLELGRALAELAESCPLGPPIGVGDCRLLWPTGTSYRCSTAFPLALLQSLPLNYVKYLHLSLAQYILNLVILIPSDQL